MQSQPNLDEVLQAEAEILACELEEAENEGIDEDIIQNLETNIEAAAETLVTMREARQQLASVRKDRGYGKASTSIWWERAIEKVKLPLESLLGSIHASIVGRQATGLEMKLAPHLVLVQQGQKVQQRSRPSKFELPKQSLQRCIQQMSRRLHHCLCTMC